MLDILTQKVDSLSSVKLAYNVLRDNCDQQKSKQVGSSSGTVQYEELDHWKKLCKLSCPPKMKRFMWRLSHDNLPLRLNIKRRGMDIETI